MESGGVGIRHFNIFISVISNEADFRDFATFETRKMIFVAHLAQDCSRWDPLKGGIPWGMVPNWVPFFVTRRGSNVTIMAGPSDDSPGVTTGSTADGTTTFFGGLTVFAVLLHVFALLLDGNNR